MNLPHFKHKTSEKLLCCEEVSLTEIAEAVDTPTYVYSTAAISEAYQQFNRAFSATDALICVSVKANSNLSLLALLNEQGAGFDVVSGGELTRVLLAGGDPKKIVFSGVGKSDQEIKQALDAGIFMFNVESIQELARINALSTGKAPVSLRVNPNVDAKTHQYINTGLREHKFGIPLEEAYDIYLHAHEYPNVVFIGVDCHIGSMLTDLAVFSRAFSEIRSFVAELKEQIATIRYLDLGGGLSVSYDGTTAPAVEQYAQVALETFAGLDLRLILEPGRFIFANAGLLLCRVLYTKQQSLKKEQKEFVVVDAASNDLMRPMLYQAYHHIEPVRKIAALEKVVDVVGPICETGDFLARNRRLSLLSPNDLIAFYSAGAYGFSMASHYNSRPKPAEVLVDGTQWKIIRSRERIEVLLYDERERLESSK